MIVINKYEHLNVMELEYLSDITDIFVGIATEYENTVAVVANRELVECVMEEAFNSPLFNPLKIDFDNESSHYMISIDESGNVVVLPTDDYDNQYFEDIDHVFISMEDKVDQKIIDYFINEDKDVVLFGYSDGKCGDDNCHCDECCGKCECKDTEEYSSPTCTIKLTYGTSENTADEVIDFHRRLRGLMGIDFFDWFYD